MKLKKEFIILFIIIAALISYLLLHKKDRTHYQLPTVPEIAKSRITQIDIATSKDAVTLNRKDKTWFIGPEEYPADPDKVNSMLDVIEALTITALVSESENYLRYDLDDDKKITVKAWEGTTIKRRFDIGKSASTFRHTFVKMEKDSKVYHARGDFRHKFDLTLDKLRDKNVLSFEPEQIKTVQISKDKQTIVVRRQERPETKGDIKENEAKPSSTKKSNVIWQTNDDRQLEESTLKRLLSSLSRLDCETYIDRGKKEDFEDSIIVVKLTGEAKGYSLSIFSKTEKSATTYPAISSENQYPFLLSDSQVDDIKKTTEEMLKGIKK